MKSFIKHIFTAALSFVFMTAVLFPYTTMSVSAAALTAKTTDYLNLRTGAGTNTSVVLTLSKNTTVTVLDNTDAQWAKVKTQSGKQGYCSKQYLSFSGGSTTSGGSTASAGTAVTTSNLNMRDSTSLNGRVLLILSKGTTITLLDNSNAQWAKVSTQSGKQGYCCKTYLKITNTAAAVSQSSAVTGTSSGITAKTTDYLNLREGAGTGSKVILTMSKGISVTVLDNTNSQWAKVRTQSGKQGWCSKQYLNISGGTPASSSSAAPTQSSTPVSSNLSSASASSNSLGTTTNTNSSTHTITGATVTATVLRLREQANTSCSILDNLAKGTKLTVLDTSTSGWVKVETSGGKTGYVSADYVKINYSDDDVSTPSGTSELSVSASSKNIPMGKTFYLKASTNTSGSTISWSSSNSSVASVTNGYVYAIGKGNTVITASCGSYTASCSITVTDAEPVRTAYASPNVASPGGTVTFTAVTDSSRDGVKFEVTAPGGSVTTISADGCQEENTSGVCTKKWTGSTTLITSGTYSVTALSSVNGVFSTTGFSTNAFVSTQSDVTVSTREQRRASDSMISLIAKWEGLSSCVYADKMTSSQVPTIGYGCTLSQNAVFYNSISQTEAWSMMVNKINNSSYTTELNKMITNNSFLMNQNQADCLISFAYNVGSAYFNSTTETDFRQIMKNAIVPPDFSGGTQYQATVTKSTVLRQNSGILSQTVCDVDKGTSADVMGCDFSNTRDGWYHVQLSNGTEGWINSGYVSLACSGSMVHDLNYTNSYAFGTELIRWNQAGGKFYSGLFYRRLGEANVYNYGDYSALRYNKYSYGYPSSASSLN